MKLRNTFANNMSTDIKLSKAQISKINQVESGGSFGSFLAMLERKHYLILQFLWLETINMD